MKDLRTLLLLALAAATSAQSAPGFPIDVTTNLVADFQTTFTSISPAGVTLQRDGEYCCEEFREIHTNGIF